MSYVGGSFNILLPSKRCCAAVKEFRTFFGAGFAKFYFTTTPTAICGPISTAQDKAGHTTHSLKLVSVSLKIVAWYLISFGSKIQLSVGRMNEWTSFCMEPLLHPEIASLIAAEFLCGSCFKYAHCPPDPIDVSSIHDIVWVRDIRGPSQIKTQWSWWRWVGDLEIF